MLTKHHITAEHLHGYRIAFCGRVDTQKRRVFHNDLSHLTIEDQQQLCLSCLKCMNTRDSWNLYYRLILVRSPVEESHIGSIE